mmetsp:Transcript_21251/g.30790  ORF Transcript_21251/g.30790 Transcript_21251/m.30790 type:complete len:190 (+) Transcript_21251:34-603(+)
MPSFAEWLCDGTWPGFAKYHTDRIFAAQINPFGIANAYHEQGGANVTMVDMAGAENRDIAGAVVCDILRLPCTAEKTLVDFPDFERPTDQNKRDEPMTLGMSDEDMTEMENIIRQMDCYYYCRVKDDINVLYAKDQIFGDNDSDNDSTVNFCQCAENKMNYADANQSFKLAQQLSCRAAARKSESTSDK